MLTGKWHCINSTQNKPNTHILKPCSNQSRSHTNTHLQQCTKVQKSNHIEINQMEHTSTYIICIVYTYQIKNVSSSSLSYIIKIYKFAQYTSRQYVVETEHNTNLYHAFTFFNYILCVTLYHRQIFVFINTLSYHLSHARCIIFCLCIAQHFVICVCSI